MNKYIIIGPPGSGKSTQAQMLAKAYGFVLISVGDILRWNLKNHTRVGAKIHRSIDSGELVPDQIVEEVLKARLEQHDWNYGFVLDGYPANQAQAEFFLESHDVNGVVHLQVPEEILAERMSNLRVCVVCGFDSDLIHDRPRVGTVCAVCGGELAYRGSESPQAIRERLRQHQAKTVPVIELFRRRELVVVVDGTKPFEDVHNRICAELGLTSEVMLELLRGKK